MCSLKNEVHLLMKNLAACCFGGTASAAYWGIVSFHFVGDFILTIGKPKKRICFSGPAAFGGVATTKQKDLLSKKKNKNRSLYTGATKGVPKRYIFLFVVSLKSNIS